MANYCYSTYIIEGEEKILKHIADTINKVDADVKESYPDTLNLGWILVALGACSEKERAACNSYCLENGFGVAGEWYDAEIVELKGKKVLKFREAFKWIQCQNMEQLVKLPQYANAITGIYYNCYLEGDDEYVTNDTESKYFE